MRKMKKIITVIAAFAFLSCTAKQARAPGQASPAPSRPAAGEAPEKRKTTIGLSVATDTFIVERWNKDVKVFSGAAQELGGDVIVQLSAGGIREQIAQINYMVNQNIDVLVVIAHDTEMIAGVIRQIRDAGIPVIAYDRMIQGAPLDAFISFENQEVGRKFGRALSEAVPRGKYLIVNGSVHDTNSFQISAGLHEIIDPLIAAGEVQIIREVWLEEWSFDEALEKISGILEENAAFDAIACGNDSIAQAAIQLLSERRMAGKIAVVGQDAELISCQHIVEGLQLMTVYKPIGRLAPRAAELAMAIAEKRTIPHDMLLDNGSGTRIPSYIEASISVFRDNMNVIIRDGFHSYEDIYRNVLWE
jgi:D-xylose transport system substrate-binding protein